MSIRAVEVVQRILDGTELDKAAADLVPHVLDTMRVRGVALEFPQRGEKVVQEYQTLWEAVGRRLVDRGHLAGLSFLVDPTDSSSGGYSAAWLLLEQLDILMDVATMTTRWDRMRYGERPPKSPLGPIDLMPHLQARVAELPEAQRQAMLRHLNAKIKSHKSNPT